MAKTTEERWEERDAVLEAALAYRDARELTRAVLDGRAQNRLTGVFDLQEKAEARLFAALERYETAKSKGA